MAWQIAVVFDRGESAETLHANLSILLGQMPVWAITPHSRVPAVAELRQGWDKCWDPEPSLTLVVPNANDPIDQTIELIPTVEEHHPRMAAVRFFGVSPLETLTEGVAALGYHPISGKTWEGLGFAKQLDRIEEVPEICMDAAAWTSADHFFDSFFKAVGAPVWHGRNFNALNDSIGAGSINRMEVPYRIVVRNFDAATTPGLQELMNDFADLILKLHGNGCPVDLRIEK